MVEPRVALESSVHPGIHSTLSTSQSKAFDQLIARCKADGLLTRPPGLDQNETQAGINDEVTLLYVYKRGITHFS